LLGEDLFACLHERYKWIQMAGVKKTNVMMRPCTRLFRPAIGNTTVIKVAISRLMTARRDRTKRLFRELLHFDETEVSLTKNIGKKMTSARATSGKIYTC
jgi:hypothetical protein